MKICEICGSVEEAEERNIESANSRTLHICEKCQEDRKMLLDFE